MGAAAFRPPRGAGILPAASNLQIDIPRMSSPRLLVLGLDGADWELLGPLIAAGYLPTFARLARAGLCGRLRSTVPPLTAPAWTSLHTGVNPGAHGVFDFFHRDPASYAVRHASAAPCAVRTVWGHLSDRGRRVVLAGLPMAEVDEPVEGVHVSSVGFEPGTVRPERLREGLRKRFDPRPLVRLRIDDGAGFARPWIERTFAVARHLAESEGPDVLAVGLSVTDWMHHRFLWAHGAAAEPGGGTAPRRAREAVRGTYAAVDAALGDLLRALPGDVRVLVCSDHGAQAVRGLLNLNGWLAERGFLVRAGGGGAARGVAPAGGRARRALRALVPEPLLAPLRALRARKREVGRIAHLDGVDWSRTRAYAVGYYGSLYYNMAGREPAGIVRQAERATLEAELTAALLDWRDPETGEPVMEAVVPGASLHRGAYAALGPDLVAIPRGWAWGALPLPMAGAGVPAIRQARALGRDAARELTWHRMHGMVLVSPPSSVSSPQSPVPSPQSTVNNAEYSIVDVAPTVLELAGCEPAPWMEGRSILGPSTSRFSTLQPQLPPPPHWGQPARPAPPTPLESRLRDLGYFE
jgi:predicted AlkP superfamily phosphohydrolase/phosphomutase